MKESLKKISDNFEITQSNNGQEALEEFVKCNKEPNVDNIKIIIMDCEMPVLDGF